MVLTATTCEETLANEVPDDALEASAEEAAWP
jgi:hypothetical protein